MPQLVALLNGFGGLASMITGILTVINDTQSDTFSMINAGIAIIIGGITFSGSMVAAGKLHKIFPQKPIVLKGHQFWTALTLIFRPLPYHCLLFQHCKHNPIKRLSLLLQASLVLPLA